MVAEAPAPAAAPAGDMIERLTEAGLDSLYGPVQYLLEDSERGTYPNLSPAGKRRFLRQVFRRRNPAAADTAIAEFLRLVAYVNSTFRESGVGSVSGWATDRGRIYLRNGRPDEVLRRPSAAPRPYEVWKYTRGRVRYYLFWDRTGLGNYELVGTNDVREPNTPWEVRLGRHNSQDVMEFIR
jgi:GWxTD domain-containing protein